MRTWMSTARVTGLAVIIGIPLLPALVCGADEERSLRPEIQQIMQSVSERLLAAADKLELTADQRSKIREINASRAEKCKTLRSERRGLLQEELKALGTILTPEQRETMKELAEDRVEQVKTAGAPGLPKFAGARETLAERAESAAEKIGLTSEQRKQICKTLSSHADRHAVLKAKCHEACEEEFQDIAAVLTAEQRQKAREYIEERVMRAAAAKSLTDRLDANAGQLGLTADQRQQIAKTHAQFAPKYRELRSERRELLQEELKAIAATLTPEQRDMVKDFWEDRVVIIGVSATGRETIEAAKALKETIAERLEAAGNTLGLTADQRAEIRTANNAFADKFGAQRNQRKALRQEELKALGEILTPEQRDKVKDFVEDHSEQL
jgi:Spy/CpxP family protein refolding chaperone